MRALSVTRPAVAVLLLVVAPFVAGGCSADVYEPEPAEANLQAISDALIECLATQGRPPRNATELQPYLRAEGPAEEVLRSPRDQQPYVIYWGTDLQGGEPGTENAARIVAHEQQGVEGRRYVLLTDGSILELDLQEFERTPKPR